MRAGPKVLESILQPAIEDHGPRALSLAIFGYGVRKESLEVSERPRRVLVVFRFWENVGHIALPNL